MAKEQLRGEKLKKHIANGLKKLATEADGKYTYNASQLSQAINVSRPTLAKHAEFIDEILKDIAAGKRFERGEGAIQMMQEKVQRLEAERESLKKELGALRDHHANIYLKVYHHATSLEPLIRPVIEEEMFESGRCILCDHQIEEIDTPPPTSPNKVIKFRPNDQGTPKK